MSVPQNRVLTATQQTIGANQVACHYGGIESYPLVFNREPPPTSISKFDAIGITNINALSCHDPRDDKGAVRNGEDFGGYRFNVDDKSQRISYQQSVNCHGFQKGRPIMTGMF